MTRVPCRLAATAVLGLFAVLPLGAAQGRGGGGGGGSTPPPVTVVNPTAFDCYSGSGCLDPAFGSLGKVLVDVGSDTKTIFALAVQSDGKIVAAGYRIAASDNWSWVIGRFSSAGVVDTTFGTGGFVTLDITPSGGELPRELAIQPDGRIVVAGRLNDLPTVVRLTSGGALDTSFGTGGKVVVGWAGVYSVGGLAIQSDGKIIVSGVASGVGTYVRRLGATGITDKTFGSKGDRLISNVFITDLALQSTGRIVAAGSHSSGNAVVARLTDSGTLDNSFGSKGITQADFGSPNDVFLELSVASDDSQAAVGIAIDTSTSGSGNMAVGRFSASGAPVTTFGSNGRVLLDMHGWNDRANGVAVQSDGRVLFSGWAYTASGGRKNAIVGRLLGNGTLDTSFGAGGVTETEFGALLHGEPITMLTSGGQLIVGGGVGQSTSPPVNELWMLLRYFQ